MSGLYNKYEIKRITDCSDSEYLQALKIYKINTPEAYFTDTNEIGTWIENNSSEYFDFNIFIIKIDKKVVGFCEAAYIYSTKTVLIDYLCFEKGFQINTSFFPTLNLIHNYFIDSFDNVLYFVFEIAKEDIAVDDNIIRKLLSVEGYNTYNFQYNHCQLGQSKSSNFSSELYLKSNNVNNHINKDTLLKIIESIYKEYNLVWYMKFMDDSNYENYKDLITNEYDALKQEYFDQDKIMIRKFECTNKLHSIDSSGNINSSKDNRSRLKKSIITTCIHLIIIIVVCFLALLISKKINVSKDSMVIVFVMTVPILSITLNKLDFFD